MSVKTVANLAPVDTPSPVVSSSKSVSKSKEEKLFDETFYFIIDDINTLNGDKNNEFPVQFKESNEYIRKCMLYNVPHGKKLRGKMVVMVYQALVPDASEEENKLARILGWCAETLQAAYLVADDIMDNGETRRGQPCWFRVEDIGINAMNDSFFLEHVAYQILEKYFGHLDCYTELINLLLGITYKTILGQGMDIRVSKKGEMDVYDSHLYRAIVTYKTGFYTVYLPVALAMVFAGVKIKSVENKELWKNVEKVTLEIGCLFQIQDDYFDCFGDEEVIGKKVGTDIQEGKCSWLFVKAKELCNEEQIKLLRQNYGSMEKKKVAVIKALYKELDLPVVFAEYQEQVYRSILKGIEDLRHEQLESALSLFLKMIYKRVY